MQTSTGKIKELIMSGWTKELFDYFKEEANTERKILQFEVELMTDKNFETLYVIPMECPDELSVPYTFGKHVIKQETFTALFPKRKNLEYKINSGLYVSWTCAGCTKAMGSNACPKRKCGLGGKKI